MPEPLTINPITLALIFIIGGISAVVTYGAFALAERAGRDLPGSTLELPMPPTPRLR